MPSESQTAGFDAGTIKHVNEAFNPAAAVAKPLVPVMVVNVAVAPGITDFDWAVATGAAGSETVGLIVASANCVVESATTYFTSDAGPLKVSNGVNVIVPFALTLYVPSPGTKSSGNVQLAFAVDVVSHSFTDDAFKVAPAPAASPVNTSIVCGVLYAPVEVSLSAVGAGGTVGVNVDVAVCPVMSVTRYVIAVLGPTVASSSATYVTIPVEGFSVYTPSPVIVIVLPATHVAGDDAGVMRHVNEAFNSASAVVNPPVPVTVVNVAVPPGITDFDSGDATGSDGAVTVAAMVAVVSCRPVSNIVYLIGVAVPLKLGSGTKVTVPSGLEL
jgi:hypothetical protein